MLTREAGAEVYDGRGNLNVIASFNSVPGGIGTFQTARLTYVVYPNCTGVLSGDRGPYANIFVAPDGSSFTILIKPSNKTFLSGFLYDKQVV